MKKTVALILISVLSLSCAAGCSEENISQLSDNNTSSIKGSVNVSKVENDIDTEESSVNYDTESSDDDNWWDIPEFKNYTRMQTGSSGEYAYFVLCGNNSMKYDKLSLTAARLNDDGTLMVASGFYEDGDSDFEETRFPGNFSSMQTALTRYFSKKYFNTEFNLVSGEKVEIHGYEMIKYRGNAIINKGGDHESNTIFVGYATRLKKNGGTACWVVLDDKKSEYHTDKTEALVEETANSLALSFHESE